MSIKANLKTISKIVLRNGSFIRINITPPKVNMLKKEYNTFDLEVMFTERSDSLLYSYISFGSSERYFYHSQVEQWKPSIIPYALGSRYGFNKIRQVSKLA